MATVQVGLPTRRRLVFVPLEGAVVGPGYVRVAHDKSLVRKSPPIGTDDVLPAGDEERSSATTVWTTGHGTAGERQLACR